MLNTHLLPHQKAAVDAWRASQGPGFAFYMEQRTGKTLTALAVADELRPARILVVCPRRVVDEWRAQIAEHITFDWPCELKIHTYGELTARAAKLKRWVRGGLVIADESHRAKRPSALASRRLRTVGLHAARRLALSGTPMGQELKDFWSQFRYLNYEIFGNLSKFRRRYCIMGGWKNKKEIAYKNVREFKCILAQHSFRITLAEVQKKKISIRKHFIRPTIGIEEDKHYSELECQLMTVVRREIIEAPLVVTLITKLQQITGGHIIDEDGKVHRIGKTKLKVALKILERKTDPIVICVRFIHELEMFKQEAGRIGKTVQTVSGAGNDFDPKDPADWIIFQIQSGVGIDVSCAHEILFYSWDYSYINHNQMMARILFYNVERVTYHYIILVPSIDELIYNVVQRKQGIVKAALQHYGDRNA